MIGMTCSRQQHPSTSSLCQTLPTPDWYLESKPRRLLGKKKNLVPAKRKRSKLSYLNGRRVSLDDSGRGVRLHVRTAAPAVVRGRQLEANLVFEHMWQRIDLDVHGPPQGDPNRRAVWRRGSLIMHDVLSSGLNC